MPLPDAPATPAEMPAEPARLMPPGLKLGLLLVGLLLLYVASRVLGLDQWLKQLQPWIASLGAWGPLAFVAVYVLATVLAVPGSVLTIAGGLLFGWLYGTLYVSLGSTLGAAACFLIARYLARESLLKTFGKNPAFQRLERMSLAQGAWLVALTRLIPLFPFNLLNYGFGLTRVPFGTYVFWSWLCMLPGTVLYVVGSDAVFTAVTEGRIPWGLVALVAGCVLLLGLVTRQARARLTDELPEQP